MVSAELDETWKQFQGCQDAVIDRDGSVELEEHNELFNNAMDNMILARVLLGEITERLSETHNWLTNAGAKNAVQDALRLPILEIAPFDGRFDKWVDHSLNKVSTALLVYCPSFEGAIFDRLHGYNMRMSFND